MVILGLDPGIAATGYGVVAAAGSRLTALAHGVVTTPARQDPARRLATIHEAVRALIEEHRPDAVAVEELFIGANPRAILAVGQARGAALSACGAASVPLGEYTVSAIKVAVCGYGRAEKGQVQRMVAVILGLGDPVRPDHAADALAAAICHAQMVRTAAMVGGSR